MSQSSSFEPARKRRKKERRDDSLYDICIMRNLTDIGILPYDKRDVQLIQQNELRDYLSQTCGLYSVLQRMILSYTTQAKKIDIVFKHYYGTLTSKSRVYVSPDFSNMQLHTFIRNHYPPSFWSFSFDKPRPDKIVLYC
jgi:hypothetical protein